MDRVVITFETIYEFLRSEKNKEELQRLPPTFFDDASNYLAEKEKILRDTASKDDIFSQKESAKIQTQINNVRNILTDIYTRREKKIIEMAINLVRTRSSIVDTSNIHANEKEFFSRIMELLETYRGKVLKQLLTAREIKVEAAPVEEETKGKKLEFLSEVDIFIDAELNEFGPYSAHDTAIIPSDIANILISEGKAREI